MTPLLSPPGHTSEVRARSALVVAPHYDDEVLGCGGLVTRLTAAGAAVRVLFLSDGSGDADEPERRAYCERRRAEARAAAEVLSLAGRDEVGLPDGRLDQHVDAAAGALRRALLSGRPELLLAPSPLEASPDHRAAFAAVHRLLAGVRASDELEPLCRDLEILLYEINHPLRPDLLVDVSDQVPQLERAMACYASQQEQHDYLAARLGLSRFRTLTLASDPSSGRPASHVEAYRRLTLEDFTTRGSERLIAELGGSAAQLTVREGPTISVIVRTKDRPELLAQALASLAAGSYRRADVVIVNDGGARPDLAADFPLPAQIVDLATNQGRSAAANVGLAAATGDCVAFLDDDDLAEPEHLATLATLIQADGVRVAYTDAAVGVYELDAVARGRGGWQCRERRLPYSRDFDPDLLLVDNYIPFNTVVIDRALALEVGEIDTDLPFFEDWDYLIRLAEHTPFHHLARVTCEYRQFRGAGHHILGDAPRERADFLAMKARVIRKHADRLTARVVARVVDRLRGETVAAWETRSQLRREMAQAEEARHRLHGELRSLERHHQALKEREEQARADIEGLRRSEREQTVLLHERGRIIGEKDYLMREQEQTLRDRERILGEQETVIGEQGAAIDDQRRILDERQDALDEQAATQRRTFAEIERLDTLVREMESSRAWRLHQWVQRWKS